MTRLTLVVEPVEAADSLVTASVAEQYTRLPGAWMNTIAGGVVAHQLGSGAARPISRMYENLTCRARELVRAVRELARRKSPLLLLRSISVDDADQASVLVQLYEASDGAERIAPAEIPAGELLGRLPVETLLEAADAIRSGR